MLRAQILRYSCLVAYLAHKNKCLTMFDEIISLPFGQLAVYSSVSGFIQVLELHRLYRMQKILMKELDLKMGSGLSYRNVSTHSFVGCFLYGSL